MGKNWPEGWLQTCASAILCAEITRMLQAHQDAVLLQHSCNFWTLLTNLLIVFLIAPVFLGFFQYEVCFIVQFYMLPIKCTEKVSEPSSESHENTLHSCKSKLIDINKIPFVVHCHKMAKHGCEWWPKHTLHVSIWHSHIFEIWVPYLKNVSLAYGTFEYDWSLLASSDVGG